MRVTTESLARASRLADAYAEIEAARRRHGQPRLLTLKDHGVLDPSPPPVTSPAEEARLILASENVSQTANRLMREGMTYARAIERAAALHGEMR
jgi:hypothetical protein